MFMIAFYVVIALLPEAKRFSVRISVSTRACHSSVPRESWVRFPDREFRRCFKFFLLKKAIHSRQNIYFVLYMFSFPRVLSAVLRERKLTRKSCLTMTDHDLDYRSLSAYAKNPMKVG